MNDPDSMTKYVHCLTGCRYFPFTKLHISLHLDIARCFYGVSVRCDHECVKTKKKKKKNADHCEKAMKMHLHSCLNYLAVNCVYMEIARAMSFTKRDRVKYHRWSGIQSCARTSNVYQRLNENTLLKYIFFPFSCFLLLFRWPFH